MTLATLRKRLTWRSFGKWIGLWLLAQLIGGFAAGFFFGRDSGVDSVLSAAIFLAMIAYAAVQRHRRPRDQGAS